MTHFGMDKKLSILRDREAIVYWWVRFISGNWWDRKSFQRVTPLAYNKGKYILTYEISNI